MADSGVDFGALLGLIGAAGIATAGSLYANRQNRKMQESANDTAINLANTAHQREVEDLRAAGLNPILSATGSGAPVPSLGVANQDNVLSSFGANARGIGQAMSKTASLQRAEAAAGIQKTFADTDASVATARNLLAQNENLREQNREIAARVENIQLDSELKKKEMNSRSSVGKIYEDVKSISKDVPRELSKSGVQLNRAGFLVPVNSAKPVSKPEFFTPGYNMPRRSRPRSGNGWRFRKPDVWGN